MSTHLTTRLRIACEYQSWIAENVLNVPRGMKSMEGMYTQIVL